MCVFVLFFLKVPSSHLKFCRICSFSSRVREKKNDTDVELEDESGHETNNR